MSVATEVAMGFVVGACAVPTLSLSADRFGSRIAGAFGGFPATVAASLFFLGRAAGAESAAEAAEVVPMVEGFLGIFLTVFALISSSGLAPALTAASVVWLALAAVPALWGPFGIEASVLSLLACLAFSLWVLETRLDIEWQEGKAVRLRAGQIITRMLLGGSTVGLAVFLGVVLGPRFGGIIASFPTVILTTLAVIYRSSGAGAAAAFSKGLLINALVNTGLFATVAHYTFTSLGVVGGTIAGLLAAAVGGMGCWMFMHRSSQAASEENFHSATT